MLLISTPLHAGAGAPHTAAAWQAASLPHVLRMTLTGLVAWLALGLGAAQAAPRAPPRLIAAAEIAVPPVPAHSPCETVDIAPAVLIPVGKSTLVRPRSPVSRIILGNPENTRAARPGGSPDSRSDDSTRTPAPNLRPGVADVDVLLLGPSEVYMLGKSIGATNVVLVDRNQRCTVVDVVVGLDVTGLQGTISQLMPEEKDVKVSAAFDSVVLAGTVSDAEALMRITDLANAYVRGQGSGSGGAGATAERNPRIINMLGVGAPQQVMLEVKVAEVSKTLLDQFGIDFSRAFALGDGSAIRFLSGIIGGGLGTVGSLSGTGSTGVPLSSADAVVGGTVQGVNGISGGNVTVTYDAAGRPTYTTTYGTVPARNATNLSLKMQKVDGLVKVLAEPSVMAISGQTGSFLAGGKIFIPVSQTNSDGTRAVTLEEKEFGVSVKFTPTVLGGGRINLKVRPEVSELNAAGVTITGINGTSVLPAFTSRKAETTVQLMDGQSFAIGGLIKNNATTSVTAFPWLGELPIIGALFRSTSFQTDRTELVFMITPRLVRPLPADYQLPTDHYVPPTRKDLILDGRTEGRRRDEAPAGAPTPTPPTGGGFDTRPQEETK